MASVSDDKQGSAVQKMGAAVKTYTAATKLETLTLLKEPKFQVTALGGACGTVLFGGAGGAVGGALGMASGATAGFVPALVTFGLSIPVGAAMCGGLGATVGAVSSGCIGVIGGAAGGRTIYVHRAEIRDGFLMVQGKCGDSMLYVKTSVSAITDSTKTGALDIWSRTRTSAQARTEQVQKGLVQLTDTTRSKIIDLGGRSSETISDRKVQVTAASAAAGGVVFGTGGGVVGGLAGAAVGVVPALFTLGLSIPFGFVLGASTGAAVGSTAGAAACGTAGYGLYSYRTGIKEESGKVWNKASEYAGVVQERACAVRASIVGGGTGSTA